MKLSPLKAIVLNPYRSRTPAGFYDPVKGHTGVDLKYKTGDTLLSPVAGTVVKLLSQNEMGNVLYLKHSLTGDIHIFAHNTSFLFKVGAEVAVDDELVVTGNTGSATTAPHSHWEIITTYPINPIDEIMSRSLGGFTGYNTDPLKRIPVPIPIPSFAVASATKAKAKGVIQDWSNPYEVVGDERLEYTLEKVGLLDPDKHEGKITLARWSVVLDRLGKL